MNRVRPRLIKLLLLSSVLALGIPQVVEWSEVYAAVNPSVEVTTGQLEEKLLAAMMDRKDSLNFTYKGQVKNLKKDLQTAIDESMQSDPYVNYTLKSYAYNYKGSSSSAQVTVTLKYRETKEQTAFVDQTVRAALNELIKPGMSDHEKVKVIHDWVVVRLAYDETLQKYTAYDGLATGTTVCQGYALLTYKMLNEAGITNRIVEGRAGGQLHAWNLVLLDGKWYHLDTTWDDPTPDRPNEVSTAYYLLTDAQIRKDHSWTKKYPAASTVYEQTLTQLITAGGVKAKVYQEMYNELEYSMYQVGNLVTTAPQMVEKARKAMSTGTKTLVFAYKGTENNLEKDLQLLYQLGMKSISYRVTNQHDSNHLRVSLSWTI